MARKALSTFDVKTDEFITLAEYQYEVGMEANAKLPAATRLLITKVYDVLKQYSTGSPLNVTEDEIDKALWVVAWGIVKDMALLDIRLGEFTFPDNQCVMCGEEV